MKIHKIFMTNLLDFYDTKIPEFYPLETFDAFKRQRLTMDEPKSPDLSGLVGDIILYDSI